MLPQYAADDQSENAPFRHVRSAPALCKVPLLAANCPFPLQAAVAVLSYAVCPLPSAS